MSALPLQNVVIAFDLDGTLADTAPDLHTALCATMTEIGLPAPTFTAMRPMIGHGARVLIERAGAAAKEGFCTERLDQLTARFIAHYSQALAVESKANPGLSDCLDALSADGAAFVVCTNKRTDLSIQLLEALGLRARFRAIIGADAVAHKKPDPGHYRAAIAAGGGQIGRSLMVGDSAADFESAHGAGASCVLTTFGYSQVPVAELGATALIDHFDQLPAIARRILAA
ncbi:MAG: HAD-IA family hydrolase [Caulobacterales bacterium]|jgi:phosphoglycolate phosphatase